MQRPAAYFSRGGACPPPACKKGFIHIKYVWGNAAERPARGRSHSGRLALSPGSTLRHQISTLSRHYPDTIPTLSRHLDTIPTLSRHYPDTIPTPRHSDTSVNRHSARHSDTSVRPVSSHLDVGPPRTASSSVNGVKAKPTLRHSTPPTPPTLDTPDTPTLQASMLTRCRPRC